MEKYYDYEHFGVNHKLAFRKGNYQNNNSLYLQLITNEDGYEEPWCSLTVNLPDYNDCVGECDAFVDTNNNGENIASWIEENNFGIFTGTYGVSGMCYYPLFHFEKNFLDELKEIL